MINRLSRVTYAKITALILSFVLILSPGLPFLPDSSASAADVTAPENLKVDSFTHNSATLSWDLVDGISTDDGYNVWVWNNNVQGWDWKYWSGTSPAEVGGFTPETDYIISVTPGKFNNLNSNSVTLTTAPDPGGYPEPPLLPPHNLRVTDVTESGITFKWEGSPGASGYDVYLNGGWKSGVWDGSNTYTFPIDSSVTGAVYSFAIAAQNPPAVSAPSNAINLTLGQLEAPHDLQVVTATKTVATLGWAPTPGATSYEIYRDGALIGTSDSNRYVAAGLTEGQSYSFKVLAKNRLWSSSDSAPITVKPGSHYNIVTYYTSWSVFERNFMPEDVDVTQLTHINYAFSDLCWKGFSSSGRPCQNPNIPLQADYVFDGEMVIGDGEVDIDNMARLNALKADNPNLKLIVSVGGWSWSDHFSRIAMEEKTRRAFANSVVDFLREYDLDGLDVDWEYPVEGGEDSNSRSPLDKENYTLLMKVVREALDSAGSVDGKYYLLTIASAQSDAFVVNADLAHSSVYLDFINTMTYDYAGDWEQLAHHNAPLYYDRNHPKASGPRLNVAGGVLGHLNGGVPHYKLVLGVPFYGPGWLNCPEPGQFQVCEGGDVPAGEKFGTYETFTFDYTDLEENYVDKNGYVRYWNEAAKVPYLYNSEKKRFISYDDAESLLYKTSLVKTLDMAGAMSWDISSDRNLTLTTMLLRELPIDGSTTALVLAAPSNIRTTAVGTNSVSLSWDSSPSATRYDVFVNRAWIGKTTGTSFVISDLNPTTAYELLVQAATETDGRTTAVSAGSKIQVTTATPSSGGGGGGGGGGAPSEPDTSGIGDPDANRLKSTTKTENGKTIVSLKTDEAVKAIKEAKSAKSQIVVVSDAAAVETLISKEVIQAIGDKGPSGLLSLIVNGVEFSIPIRALKLGEDVISVRITIGTPDQATIDGLREAAKARGASVLAGPLEFKVEAVSSGDKVAEIKDFGSVYVSRIFTLDSKTKVNPKLASGVLYDPQAKSYRHVPTLFTIHSDGTVTAELKRTGNSIYGIVQAKQSMFLDANLPWAKDDIEKAVARDIATADFDRVFGAKKDITRGELVSLIVNGLGILPGEKGSPFKDVGGHTMYGWEISAASNLGIVNGKTANTFDPMGMITRQEMAAILERAMKFAGSQTNATPEALSPFDDRSDVAPYARSALALLVKEDIMNGVSPTALAPKGTLTKAQATVAVMRMLRALKLSD